MLLELHRQHTPARLAGIKPMGISSRQVIIFVPSLICVSELITPPALLCFKWASQGVPEGFEKYIFRVLLATHCLTSLMYIRKGVSGPPLVYLSTSLLMGIAALKGNWRRTKTSQAFSIPVENAIIRFAFSHHIHALRKLISDCRPSCSWQRIDRRRKNIILMLVSSALTSSVFNASPPHTLVA